MPRLCSNFRSNAQKLGGQTWNIYYSNVCFIISVRVIFLLEENISTEVSAPILALKLLRRDGVLAELKEGPKSRAELFHHTHHLYENPNLFGYDLKRLDDLGMIEVGRQVCITPKGVLYNQLKDITRDFAYTPIVANKTGKQRRVYLTKMHIRVLCDLFYREKLKTMKMREVSKSLDMSVKSLQKSLKDLRDIGLIERRATSLEDIRHGLYRIARTRENGRETSKGTTIAETIQCYASAAKMVSRIKYIPTCTYTISPELLSIFSHELQDYVVESRKRIKRLGKVNPDIQNDEMNLGKEDYFPLAEITNRATRICEQEEIEITSRTLHGSKEGIRKILEKEIAGCFIALESLRGKELTEFRNSTTILFTFDWGVQNWWEQFLYVKESRENDIMAGYDDKSLFDRHVVHRFTDKYSYSETPVKSLDDSMERIAKGRLQARFGSKEPEGLFCEWVWKLRGKEKIPSGTLVYVINEEILSQRPNTVGVIFKAYMQTLYEFRSPDMLAADTLHYSTVVTPKLTAYLRLAKRQQENLQGS